MTTPENYSEVVEHEKEEVVCHSKLARKGIHLLLNNKQEEAENLFKMYPESIQMNAGYAYAVFTDALMTFEDDKLQLAQQTLKDLEKRCSGYTGWMRSVKARMFGADNTPVAEQLESQIILADTHVFVATLTFLQQDISGYFKGGWILRKSYKHYQQAYNEILSLYNEIVGDNNVPQQIVATPTTPELDEHVSLPNNNQDVENPQNIESPPIIPANMETEEVAAIPEPIILANHQTEERAQTAAPIGIEEETVPGNPEFQADPANTTEDLQEVSTPILEGPNVPTSIETPSASIQSKNGKDIDRETISRLLCAVSFGYGLLQLGISLLPPSMLKVTSFLGFGGNRTNGLENLMFARLGTDMRAPFATLTLLWYHTIVRPFFALDGNNVQAGVEAAAQLIEETKLEYGQSALFLFFSGRVERLNSDIPAAIKAFQTAIENSTQREIKMMSLHEVGWCYLIQLDYSKSETTFNCLKQSSRWSRPFYSYLSIISAGSNHGFQDTTDIGDLRNMFQPVPKGTQLDEFLNRRYKVCPVDENALKATSCLFWKMLVYELLYLWNTLPSCTNENIHTIIGDCEAASEMESEPTIGLAKLIEGSCLCILRRFNEGVDSFRCCLEKRKKLPYNCDAAHVSAFAQFELGMLLIKNEQTLAEGKRLLQFVACNYKDYDFEQRLSVRVHAVLKNL